MKQTKLMSLTESLINICVGFGISLGAQATFLPMLGVEVHLMQNLYFALIMTVISIGRSFTLRRLFEKLHIRRPLSTAMQAVVAERFRQVDGEAFTAEHDDKHAPGELAAAGAAYILHAALPNYFGGTMPPFFPWEAEWWKPQGFWRDLVRGAALVIAEMDRALRMRARRKNTTRAQYPAPALLERLPND